MIDFNNIKAFWEWFKEVEFNLHKGIYEPVIIDKIDRFVNQLNDQLDWEIGPESDSDEQYFCISPSLNKDLIGLTSNVISEAPALGGWKFYSMKPKKGWVPSWVMYNEVGQKINVNASNWCYELFSYDDNTFDIEVVADGIDGNEKTRYWAVEICITNILGEEVFMDRILNLKVVNFFNDDNNKGLLKNLGKHLDKLSSQ